MLIATELNEGERSQIRMSVLSDDSFEGVAVLVKHNIKSGSTIWVRWNNRSREYRELSVLGFNPKTVASRYTQLKNCYCDLLPPIDNLLVELQEKSLLGKLQCFQSTSRKTAVNHINHYLAECCFKFNKWDSQEAWFYELLTKAAQLQPIPYKEIVSNDRANA